MAEFKVFGLDNVTSGDTYEIAYAHSYPEGQCPEGHWSKDSLYFPDDENGIGMLSPHLDKVFPDYAYYGPQKVPFSQWAKVEALCREANPENPSVERFFSIVSDWLQNGSRGADFFWILGI